MKKLELYDLSMDVSAWEVKRDGEKIELSFTEFIILRFMLMNIGIVLTRREFIVAIQSGIDEFADNKKRKAEYKESSNIVDVYINSLRRKIDNNYEKKLIHTVRERGYKIKYPE